MTIRLINGDCLEEMKSIPDGSVDMILADPPYGTTACEWDSIIPLEPMWEQLKRVIKSNGAIVMTASQPFTTTLISSNRKMFKYCWVWNKRFSANYLTAKYQPMKIHEDVIVFNSSVYNPQMVKRNVSIKKGKNELCEMHGNKGKKLSDKYIGKVYTHKHPVSIILFSVRSDGRKLHPTQKPVTLMEYLIKTYTNENDTVLDFCMGSGTTGVACVNLNRSFIGIELDEFYFDDAAVRIDPTYRNPKDKRIDDILDRFFPIK